MKIFGVDIRPGMILEDNSKLYRVLKTQHTQPGKGGAYMMVEMKCITDGTKRNERYRSADTVEKVALEGRPMQYLFRTDDSLTFMDTSTYDQVILPAELIGDQIVWLTENMEVHVEFYNEQPVTIALPDKVEVEVTEADPVVKGQTAASSYKSARVSNGQRIQVPPYIEAGTRVIVNTADGSFVSRAQ